MSGICDGRVVAITGAGRGIGRAYALEFARQGARVVVNDLGGDRDGSGASTGPAHEVVDEIKAMGGEAVANGNDISDFDGARELVEQAVTTFGQLDVMVNNAGILRDRTLANMSIEEWDAVIRVHLRGTFGPSRWAATHWKDRSKAIGGPVGGRLINTASSSGLYSTPGQVNYAAAKAGIASLTIVAARELERYGVTANAVYPTALSRLTQGIIEAEPKAEGEWDPFDPANFAPVVAWLGSDRSAEVTGRVFGLRGGRIVVAEGWSAMGEPATAERAWNVEELDEILPALVAKAAGNADVNGQR